MRASYVLEMHSLEYEIAKLTPKRARIASKYNVCEWQIGRKIKESQLLIDNNNSTSYPLNQLLDLHEIREEQEEQL